MEKRTREEPGGQESGCGGQQPPSDRIDRPDGGGTKHGREAPCDQKEGQGISVLEEDPQVLPGHEGSQRFADSVRELVERKEEIAEHAIGMKTL